MRSVALVVLFSVQISIRPIPDPPSCKCCEQRDMPSVSSTIGGKGVLESAIWMDGMLLVLIIRHKLICLTGAFCAAMIAFCVRSAIT